MMVRARQNSRTFFMPGTRAPDGCGRAREPKGRVRHLLAFDWPVAARLKPTMSFTSWPINPWSRIWNLLTKPSNGTVTLADVREPTARDHLRAVQAARTPQCRSPPRQAGRRQAHRSHANACQLPYGARIQPLRQMQGPLLPLSVRIAAKQAEKEPDAAPRP
jgi:hypothetical protein